MPQIFLQIMPQHYSIFDQDLWVLMFAILLNGRQVQTLEVSRRKLHRYVRFCLLYQFEGTAHDGQQDLAVHQLVVQQFLLIHTVDHGKLVPPEIRFATHQFFYFFILRIAAYGFQYFEVIFQRGFVLFVYHALNQLYCLFKAVNLKLRVHRRRDCNMVSCVIFKIECEYQISPEILQQVLTELFEFHANYFPELLRLVDVLL